MYVGNIGLYELSLVFLFAKWVSAATSEVDRRNGAFTWKSLLFQTIKNAERVCFSLGLLITKVRVISSVFNAVAIATLLRTETTCEEMDTFTSRRFLSLFVMCVRVQCSYLLVSLISNHPSYFSLADFPSCFVAPA